MKEYIKILNLYLSANDTELKRFLIKRKRESSKSEEMFIDDFLFNCGLVSANVVPLIDTNNKFVSFNLSKG